MIDDDGDSIYGREGSGSEEENDDEGKEEGEEKGEEDNERDDTRSVRSDTLSIQSAAEKAKKKEKHASRPPPGKREDEITQKVRVCVSSMSARVCNPSDAIINLDHVRFGTLLDKSAVDPSKDMWYNMASRGDEADDGATVVILKRAEADLRVFSSHFSGYGQSSCETVADQIKDVIDSGSGLGNLSISVHVPMNTLNNETYDAGMEDEDTGGHKRVPYFVVNEDKVFKSGRNSWSPTEPRKCALNTQIRITHWQNDCDWSHTFRYVNGQPAIEIRDGSEHETVIFAHALVKPQAVQAHSDLLDFTQYCEYELKCARPDTYTPAKTEILLVAGGGIHAETDAFKNAALIMHAGCKIRFEPTEVRSGTWFTYKVTPSKQCWTLSESDAEAKRAITIAATELEGELLNLAARNDLECQYRTACKRLHVSTADIEEGKPAPGDWPDEKNVLYLLSERMRSCSLLQRGGRHTTPLDQIKHWVTELDFHKSFEDCFDIGYSNGVQQMRAPWAFIAPSADQRVLIHMCCPLPASPSTDDEKAELEKLALGPFLDVFVRLDVSHRELDKAACILTGSCQYMPNANIRPQLGCYNPSDGKFTGGVGKDALGGHIGAVVPPVYFCKSWPMGVFSYTIKPDQNNPMFQGLEKQLGHWISDKSSDEKDGSGVRTWTDFAKGMWTGSIPAPFPVILKHVAKVDITPRSNAVYICAQQFGKIRVDSGWRRRVEASPYPRVPNLPENKLLIDAGVETFEPNDNFVNASMNMTNEIRGKHLRYWTNRAILIMNDPAAAHPKTQQHDVATAQFWDVVSAVPEQANEEDAMEDLADATASLLVPCEERAISRIAVVVSDTEARTRFQEPGGHKGARCFCLKRKVAEACSFTLSEFTVALLHSFPALHSHFSGQSGRTGKMAKAVQKTLNLPVTGQGARVNGMRGAIFGWKLKQEAEPGSTDREHTYDPDAKQRQEQESSVNTEGRDNTQPRSPNVHPTPGYRSTVSATGDFNVLKRQKVTPPAVAPAQKSVPKSKKKSKKTVRCVDCGVKVTKADADFEGVWDTEHEDWTCDECKDDEDDEEDNESDDDEDDESDDDDDDDDDEQHLLVERK